MARVAYQRWRKSVNIVDTIVDVRVNLPIADQREADTVKRLLGQIAAAFQEAEKTSEQFESKEPDTKASRGVGANDLQAAYQAAIEMRQKGTGPWKKFRWVVHDKKVLATLTGRIEEYVEGLTRLFPGKVEKTQMMLATLELQQRVPVDSANEREKLVEVLTKTEKSDRILREVANDAIKKVDERHQFLRTTVRDGGKASLGDAYGPGAEKMALGAGAGHRYEDTNVYGQGAKASLGDRFNMPDFLAD